MKAPDVSVSLVHRNGKEMLRECIDSLSRSTDRLSIEIIVVDNGSTDGSIEMLRAEHPEVKIVQNEKPLGYGSSHNCGFDASTAPYFLIMNNDMVVLPGAIDTMLQQIKSSPEIGAVGCKLISRDGSLQISCGRDVTLIRQAISDIVPFLRPLHVGPLSLSTAMTEWDHASVRDVCVLAGCCILVPRQVFNEAGKFDDSFEFFLEEFDLCRRIRALGRRVVFTPQGEIIHLGGQSMKQQPLRMHQVNIESRYRYFVKHCGRLQAKLVIGSAMVGAMLRAFAWKVRGALTQSAKETAQACTKFHYDTMLWITQPGRPWTRKAVNERAD